MAKFYGKIGFITTEETQPRSGIWEEVVVEKNYYGDLIRNTKRWDSSEYRNDDININNDISIVADPYANENFFNMRYVEFMGSLWKITGVEVQYPRLILSIGGVYNGDTAESPESSS